ncbi:MAG: RagB/SusD family nutrient uptake outer membrane protein [Prevotellaceae bacterium]|jgi:hypothetical protein|nr:RagB/SusD family nutrient uptake outer membrane protein [Prevotellaceae bacterium]
MKAVKYVAALLFAAGFAWGVGSCVADLEEYNPSGSTADNLFGTESGHTGLVNICYSQLRKEFYGRENAAFISMLGTDIIHESRNRTDYSPAALYGSKLVPENSGLIKNCWERLYIPINDCNAAIERAVTAAYSSEALRRSREAEARFLRAFYYWHIVEQWGGVQLKLDETKAALTTATRSSVRDFYEKCILPDLEFAARDLPAVQADHGRATKASAQGMLARMYLTWASHLQYFENNPTEAEEYYRKAKAAADTIINNQGAFNVSLYDDVAEVFDPTNNKDNKEAMFVVSHSIQTGLNPQKAVNRLCTYFVSTYEKGMGVVQDKDNGYAVTEFAPTRYLLELYGDSDARYAAFFKEVWRCNDSTATGRDWTETNVRLYGKDSTVFAAGPDVPTRFKRKLEFKVGDTVLYYTRKSVPNKATVRYAVRDIDDLYNPDGTFKGATSDNFFPQLRKYDDPLYLTIDGTSTSGRLDVILMRLAEMYLIAAEAQFHLTQNDNNPEAISYINELRRRAAIPLGSTNNDVAPGEIAASGNGQGGYLNFILDERARELCGELLRWYDLKRTKQLEHRLGPSSSVHANPNVTLFDKEKHYVRPVPITFLQSINNAAEFGNNPNY